jgi:hypothetical protein
MVEQAKRLMNFGSKNRISYSRGSGTTPELTRLNSHSSKFSCIFTVIKGGWHD